MSLTSINNCQSLFFKQGGGGWEDNGVYSIRDKTIVSEIISNTNYFIRFNNDNAIKFNQNTLCNILVVGGGGAGGGGNGPGEGGSGGGAGSVGIGTFTFLANQIYNITIGVGGTSTNSTTNTNGGNTIISTNSGIRFQAFGGGKGMICNYTTTIGENGGSGGGTSNPGGRNPPAGRAISTSYSGITFYGTDGSLGFQNSAGGGGGGAGGIGSSYGTAGIGKTWLYTGSEVFGQGGYGGNNVSINNFIPINIIGISGYGGKPNTNGGDGTPANSGNGGGGGGARTSLGGNGANGCFIINFNP